ncbi:phosphoglucosamine mutase [Desulfonatronum thiosulfatophilum]|uniref:Phosphoglucosamine mutase n=1 Tax=Desulfonatronum thiosulfatophilum TaxID=617002 RepID=A0A1G6D4E3_9BACT|nr:phosphoglucosamine mutase [Desulfonatronum thiosulfatophilum]SDB40032.1 phosphoglucosamine mutase [Desulfonatronum thiosulfatophilum]
MRKGLFGTDGMRGQVNIFPMLPEIALRLGLAVGQTMRNGSRRHRVVVGKDTRLSGYVFETALTSGFCASGMDVYLVGPMPTPAISFLTRNMRADVGVVISASHNPFMDNGIKLFDRFGFKLADDMEDRISEMILSPDTDWDYPQPEAVGKAFRIQDSLGRYLVFLKNTIPSAMTFDGMKVVLDCANGATYKVAPLLFEELGARVEEIGTDPDGLNINRKCGSLYPELMAHHVLDSGADIGLALDGDGDRLIVTDERGKILDGDQIMAICARDMLNSATLPGNTLVATVMSNMSLEIFMKENSGRLLRTPVGDRYVVEAMRREGALFGGEQSGHLIFLNHCTTGDGILAALQLMRIMQETGKPLSELATLLTPFPQVLVNVHVERKIPFDQSPEVVRVVSMAEQKLGTRGRVLLRYSGTEPVARVMVEGEEPEMVQQLADEIVDVLRTHLR